MLVLLWWLSFVVVLDLHLWLLFFSLFFCFLQRASEIVVFSCASQTLPGLWGKTSTRFRVVWRQSVHWFPAQQNVVTCLACWTWAQMCHAHTLVSSPHFTTLLINTTQHCFKTRFQTCQHDQLGSSIVQSISFTLHSHQHFLTLCAFIPSTFNNHQSFFRSLIQPHPCASFHTLTNWVPCQKSTGNKAHDNHQHTIMHLINVVLCVNRVTPCSIINNSFFINRLALNKSIHLSLLDRVCGHEHQTQATHCWQTTPSGALIWRISKE